VPVGATDQARRHRAVRQAFQQPAARH